jgi:AraC family transcriptional activator of mtrCDE
VLRGDGNGSLTSVKLVAPWTAVTDAGLRAVVNAMVNEPEKQWTIAGLACVAGVSRATLTRRFSAATGMG